jgi:hypothetical protein
MVEEGALAPVSRPPHPDRWPESSRRVRPRWPRDGRVRSPRAPGGSADGRDKSPVGRSLVGQSRPRAAPTSLTTWYGHMQSVSVKTGDVVTAGQQIGAVGSLGNSSGCHLHLEVPEKNGSIYGPDNVNPTPWLAKHVGTFLGGAGTVPPAGIRVVETTPGQRGTALTKRPDIIAWTGAASSSSSALRPAGYSSWRDAAAARFPSSRATAISWRTSRWEALGKAGSGSPGLRSTRQHLRALGRPTRPGQRHAGLGPGSAGPGSAGQAPLRQPDPRQASDHLPGRDEDSRPRSTS